MATIGTPGLSGGLPALPTGQVGTRGCEEAESCGGTCVAGAPGGLPAAGGDTSPRCSSEKPWTRPQGCPQWQFMQED